MNILVRKPKYKIWAKELSRFFSLQIGITLVNLIAGLLILRLLPKVDYALYTVGFAAIGVFTQVSNSGVAPIVNAVAGQNWQDKIRMGSVINTAISFRKRVGIALALPVAAYCVWQYKLLGVDYSYGLLLTLTFGVIGLLTLEMSILRIPFVYAKRVLVIQRVDLQSAITKLFLILLAGFIYPNTFMMALAVVVATLWAWLAFRRGAKEHADLSAPHDPDARSKIWNLFKLNAPGTLYWSFQGQVTILLCSIFATTENVAEIGALGRLTMIFAILNTFVGAYLIPEISKATTLSKILKVSGVILGIFALSTSFLMSLAWLRPAWLLFILGSKYDNLSDVLLLFVGVSMLSVFQNQISGMCGSRGWMKWFVLYIPVTLVTQIIAVLLLDLSSLKSIIMFNGAVASASLLLSIGVYGFELFKYSRLQLVPQNAN